MKEFEFEFVQESRQQIKAVAKGKSREDVLDKLGDDLDYDIKEMRAIRNVVVAVNYCNEIVKEPRFIVTEWKTDYVELVTTTNGCEEEWRLFFEDGEWAIHYRQDDMFLKAFPANELGQYVFLRTVEKAINHILEYLVVGESQ